MRVTVEVSSAAASRRASGEERILQPGCCLVGALREGFTAWDPEVCCSTAFAAMAGALREGSTAWNPEVHCSNG